MFSKVFAEYRRFTLKAVIVVAALTLCAGLATAATTISTDIQTDGTLSVTGTSTLTGNVGINTLSPAYPLDVNGNVSTEGQLRFRDLSFTSPDGDCNDPNAYSAMYELHGSNGGVYTCAESYNPAHAGDDDSKATVMMFNPTYTASTPFASSTGAALFLVTGNQGSGPSDAIASSEGVAVGTPIFGVSDDYSPNLILSAVGTDAGGYIPGYGRVGVNQDQPRAALDVTLYEAGTPGVIVQGGSGQTSNLQQWQDSSATILAGVTKSGGAYFGDNTGIGTTSPAYGLSIDMVTGTAATSTISDGSSTHPSCLQLYAPNGTGYAVYVSNAGILTATAGSCR